MSQPFSVRFFITQALQAFCGTPPTLREKYYRTEHGTYEIGIGDIGRLLVAIEENTVLVLDFKPF